MGMRKPVEIRGGIKLYSKDLVERNAEFERKKSEGNFKFSSPKSI